ncbi:MAG: GDP-mannose 4,6-dehydratase [Nitrososphaerales archaeon]
MHLTRDTILVTGSTGFMGSNLVSYLKNQNANVHTMGRENDKVSSDVTSKENIARILSQEKFSGIFHLAARTNIKDSWSDHLGYLKVNFEGTLNILEELRLQDSERKTRFLLASSSSVYGNSYQSIIEESFPKKPVNPYALSKSCAESLCEGYFSTYGIKTKIARPFYVTGNNLPRGVIAEVCKTIVSIECNEASPEIKVGNTDAIIDVVDIHDCVSALDVILRKGEAGHIYNVSTGKGHSIGEIIEMLLSKTKGSIRITKSIDKTRKQDMNFLVGDCKKLQALGWSNAYSLDRTLDEMLEYWRNVTSISK